MLLSSAPFLQHTAEFVFHLFVTILVMFYLYRDGESLVARFRQILPFAGPNRERMLEGARELIFASVTSSLLAAAAHGCWRRLAFAITQVGSPDILGRDDGILFLDPCCWWRADLGSSEPPAW